MAFPQKSEDSGARSRRDPSAQDEKYNAHAKQYIMKIAET